MAKNPKPNKVQMNLLAAIADATKKNEVYYIEKNPDTLVLNEQKLIEVNAQMTDAQGRAAARASAAGMEMLAKAPAKPAAGTAPTPSNFAFISGAVPPPTKRGGGGGAPAKYPFDQMEVNISIHVKNTEVSSGDAVKSVQSSVAAFNHTNSVGTGEMETVERTKRGPGNKAEVDAAGNKVKETVQREKRKAVKKLIVRKVEAGKVYGGWTCDADGALITRLL